MLPVIKSAEPKAVVTTTPRQKSHIKDLPRLFPCNVPGLILGIRYGGLQAQGFSAIVGELESCYVKRTLTKI